MCDGYAVFASAFDRKKRDLPPIDLRAYQIVQDALEAEEDG